MMIPLNPQGQLYTIKDSLKSQEHDKGLCLAVWVLRLGSIKNLYAPLGFTNVFIYELRYITTYLGPTAFSFTQILKNLFVIDLLTCKVTNI